MIRALRHFGKFPALSYIVKYILTQGVLLFISLFNTPALYQQYMLEIGELVGPFKVFFVDVALFSNCGRLTILRKVHH